MRPYLSLKYRDFRSLWVAQADLPDRIPDAGRGDRLARLSADPLPLALGMVGLSRVIPIVTFSLPGVVADRYDRKRVMLATQLTMTAVAATLGLLTLTGHETLLSLYLLTAMTSAAGSFDNPARQALVPRLVPREVLPGALAMNLTMFHVGMIMGPGARRRLDRRGRGGNPGARMDLPLECGLVPRRRGNASRHAGLRESRVDGREAGIARRIAPPGAAVRLHHAGDGLDDGARFRGDVFLGANSLLPIFADQVLKVGAFGFGWLRAAPALGALVGSIYTSIKPIPARQGRVLLSAVAAYGLRDGRVRPLPELRVDALRAGRDGARRSRLDRRPADRADKRSRPTRCADA